MGGAAGQSTASLQPRWLAADTAMGNRPSLVFDGDPDLGATGNILSIANVPIRRGTIVTIFYGRAVSNPTRLVYEHSADTNLSDGLYLNTHDNDSINLRRGYPLSLANSQSSRDVGPAWAVDEVSRTPRTYSTVRTLHTACSSMAASQFMPTAISLRTSTPSSPPTFIWADAVIQQTRFF
jgi:hypothetical protein